MQEKDNEKGAAALAGVVPKPHVVRVELPGGGVRLIGLVAAARWLGCSAPALGMVARGVPGRGERLALRAREEFPGLFGDDGE